MQQSLADALYEVITRELPNLQQISEEQSGEARSPGAWTRKQELGHLIDSAANNHIRFVSAAVQEEFRGPGYDQNAWINLHGYDDLPWSSLVHFWFRYNALIVQVLQRIPPVKLQTPCIIGANSQMTLAALVEDYLLHLRHHLDQILRRQPAPRSFGSAPARQS